MSLDLVTSTSKVRKALSEMKVFLADPSTAHAVGLGISQLEADLRSLAMMQEPVREDLRESIALGNIFVYPNSLFAEYLSTSAINSLNRNDVEHLKLPYDKCILLGVNDTNPDSNTYGWPTYMSVMSGGLDIHEMGGKAYELLMYNSKLAIAPAHGAQDKEMTSQQSVVLMTAQAQFLTTMLRSKNTYAKEVPPVSKALAKRQTKAGKIKYHAGFTVVTDQIHIPASGEEEGEGSRAAHWVRGHFKNRRTGTFWWSPHTAGAGEIKNREGYFV